MRSAPRRLRARTVLPFSLCFPSPRYWLAGWLVVTSTLKRCNVDAYLRLVLEAGIATIALQMARTPEIMMGMKDEKPMLADCKTKVPGAAEPDAGPDAERKIERAAPRIRHDGVAGVRVANENVVFSLSIFA